jgi:antitoxin YefM
MTSISTSYTSHIQAQKDLVKVLNQVEQGDAVVVIQRPGHADVAMIAANELSVLLEEVYLLRSPINSKRLFEAIKWSEQKLSEPLESTSLEQLRQELETELKQSIVPNV